MPISSSAKILGMLCVSATQAAKFSNQTTSSSSPHTLSNSENDFRSGMSLGIVLGLLVSLIVSICAWVVSKYRNQRQVEPIADEAPVLEIQPQRAIEEEMVVDEVVTPLEEFSANSTSDDALENERATHFRP